MVKHQLVNVATMYVSTYLLSHINIKKETESKKL